MEKMLKVKEVAKLLNCSEKAVRKAIRDGSLPSVKIGNRVFRVPESALVPKVREVES